MSSLICGIDEAGRGPLAGPVVAAAVILSDGHGIHGITDSKKLSAERREELSRRIKEKAIAWSIATASVAEIDAINIFRATLLAMSRAISGLSVMPQRILVDGKHCPETAIPAEAIIKGDAKVEVIGAASILAKTARDEEMLALHRQYPEFGFDQHKGYPTPRHLEMLQVFGPAEIHRRSFAPVRRALNDRSSRAD